MFGCEGTWLSFYLQKRVVNRFTHLNQLTLLDSLEWIHWTDYVSNVLDNVEIQ
jgi:hypothetical protein